MGGNPLDKHSIGALVNGSPPLVESYLSLEAQLQPNGFDTSLREVAALVSPGSMGCNPDQRELSAINPLEFGADGWLELGPGPYLVTFNEVVNLPLDVMALGRTRSSLLRSGVSIHTAVWDAGYQGRSPVAVGGTPPFRISYPARRQADAVDFFRLPRPTGEGYQGHYQRENLG